MSQETMELVLRYFQAVERTFASEGPDDEIVRAPA
jgi:hypothetical protein